MMALQQAKEILNAEMNGEDVEFRSVSTDTRSLKAGDLYIALQGERFDGHDYLVEAEKAGAVAAIIAREVETALPYLKVEDTRKALGKLAAGWRQKFAGKVVGVTGSNGKTTVKEMIAAILTKQGSVLATRGNFNNDIGLPLTLLRMENEDYAVIEMGANHSGEIAYLTDVTRPDIALITNAGPAHLDGFGSLKGVAEAKGEIYQGLGANGIAIINRDDSYAEYWESICKISNIVGFSMTDKSAEVFGKWQKCESDEVMRVSISTGNIYQHPLEIRLQVPGVHNLMNALAAISVAVSLQVPGEKIEQALNEFEPVKGRLNIHKVRAGFSVIDDTYNANPASLKAGLDVLTELPGEHWLVLGDMGELGEEERRLHFDAGIKARMGGVTCLLALGDASRHAVEAFGSNAYFFEDRESLIEYIKNNQPEELGLLVKGSRFMHMEEIVESLIKRIG